MRRLNESCEFVDFDVYYVSIILRNIVQTVFVNFMFVSIRSLVTPVLCDRVVVCYLISETVPVMRVIVSCEW